jgi:UDP-glucuronate decarboxylase
MEHVIVTGGAGFIGSHLVERLLEMGYRVTIIDNFSTGHTDKLIEFIDNPHLKLLNHDITLPLNLRCDYLFNLASRASPKDFEVYPLDILMTNSIGVRNMIELAQHCGARFLQASTSEVYGDPTLSPQNEEYRGNVSSTGIRSCYDEGKRFAEALLFSYYRSYNLDIRIARIFNTYGPKMNIDDGRVIPNFFKQSITGSDLTIYGDGKQVRSFCYITDLIDGLLSVMFAEPKIAKGEIFNIGNPNPISITTLAKEIISLIDSPSNLIYQKLPEDDPITRCPDISKIKLKLGWEPKIDRKTGLSLTYKYFASKLN